MSHPTLLRLKHQGEIPWASGQCGEGARFAVPVSPTESMSDVDAGDRVYRATTNILQLRGVLPWASGGYGPEARFAEDVSDTESQSPEPKRSRLSVGPRQAEYRRDPLQGDKLVTWVDMVIHHQEVDPTVSIYQIFQHWNLLQPA